MKKLIRRSIWLGFVIEIACCCHPSFGGPVQSAVSLRDPGQAPPAGGSGDSLGPIISQDGRYVLFASTANNLVLNASNAPLPVLIPPRLNVFLRDRTNQTTTLVSVNLSGSGGGNGDSIPVAISTNGQYVLFESTAGNLVTGDTNGVNDVFLRDLTHGTTLLASASTNGGCANGLSRNSVMTPDGRYVAFTSEASNLVAFDTNGIADVFVRDTKAATTTPASVGALNAPGSIPGFPLTYSLSDWPAITPDGRYVAFASTATNLIAGSQTVGDIYVRDLVGSNTIWASTSARSLIQSSFSSTNSNIVCQSPVISADGNYVAFEARPMPSSGPSVFGVLFRFNIPSSLTDVISTNAGVSAQLYDDPGDLNMTPDGQNIAFVANTNISSGAETCIEIWSALTGTTTLASANLSNAASANAVCDWPAIDSTGRYVAFQSSATDLTTNSLLGTFHLFVRDLDASTTTLVDVDANGVGTGVGPDAIPNLSSNGPSVAFQAPDGNLVPNDRNRALDVFVRNVAAGTNEMVSACPPALSSLTPNGLSGITPTSVSGNGRYVAFTSDADNLVPDDTNGWRDVFVRDLVLGTNILVSASTNGGVGNDESFGASISADGRYVAFISSASNLVANDFNNFQDVFVRDTQLGTTVLASVNTNGVSGNRDSGSAMIAGNGAYVLFQSRATDLAPGSYNGAPQNLFLRDLQGNATYVLTTGNFDSPSTTPDGRYVFFATRTVPSGVLNIWDTQVQGLVYSTSMVSPPAVSVDGNIIVCMVGTHLVKFNRTSNTTNTIVSGSLTNAPSAMGLSSDGHWLVYALRSLEAPVNPGDVYLYDMAAGTNTLITHGYTVSVPPGSPSDSLAISSSGRFVAYRSAVNDVVPNATNGARNILVYDQTNASTTLITVSLLGNMAANSHSMLPVFSGDGQTLVFQSWSSDLVTRDGNFNSDIFAYTLVTNGASQAFFAQIVAAGAPGLAPTISWNAVPGKIYMAQYKNNLTDPGWQNVSGGITIVGSEGYFTDPAPAPNQRFYRIVAF